MKLEYCVLAFLFTGVLEAQQVKVDNSPNRALTGLDIPFVQVGTIIPKSTFQTNNKYWTIGCETVDRDYTVYDSYKDYLAPLGIRKARFQCGWAKTEKEKGKYDFTWIDEVVDDMADKNIEMWAELSYGNPIYKDGGGMDLGGGLPTSEESLKAWDSWVKAMVERYKGKINEWEIWNEADLNSDNTPEKLAEFNLRTVKIIKEVDPAAKIAALTLCGLHSKKFIEKFLEEFKRSDRLKDIEWISFHAYPYNPDALYDGSIENIKSLVHKYAPNIKLRQGESGCPSEYQVGHHALREYHWSELTQAKWFLLRMMGDLGNGVDESSVFCLMDMVYLYDIGKPEKFKFFNRFGLIRCDSLKQAEKIKQSYYAVQNTVSLFDQPLELIDNKSEINDNHKLTSFLYRNKESDNKMLVIWNGNAIPADSYITENATVQIENSNFKRPVWIDLLSGRIYEIPINNWKKKGAIDIFQIPVYDSPVVITDISSVSL